MKRHKNWQWPAVAAIMVLGAFIFVLAQQGVPSKKPPPSQQAGVVTKPVRLVRAGPGIPFNRTLPVFPPVTVDYRSDGPAERLASAMGAPRMTDLASREPSGATPKANPRIGCVVDGGCYACNVCMDYECIDLTCQETPLDGDTGVPGCDDGEYCNGEETCMGGTCHSGTAVTCPWGQHCDEYHNTCRPDCTVDGDCDDRESCTADTCDGSECVYENACGPGALCEEPATVGDPPICIEGRCCDVSASCTRDTYADCLLLPGKWLAVGDSETDCYDVISRCPTYGSGIVANSTRTAVVGPISNLGCDDIVRFGDDYETSNHSTQLFMTLEALRWVGGVFPGVSARWSVELRDENGILIENVFYPAGVNDSDGLGVRTLIFDPPITVPTKGIISFAVLGGFGLDGRVLVGTTDAEDVGSNTTGTMYVETRLAGVPQIRDFLGVCNGGDRDGLFCDRANGNDDCTDGGTCNDVPDIMSFELVGTATTEPLGACCDTGTGDCTQQLPWECTGAFQSVGSLCGICEDGETPCDGPEDCAVECSALPACVTQACCDTPGGCSEVVAPADCPPDTDTQGFGTDCDPNCCVQSASAYNGADNCLAAENGMQIINVPLLGAPPVTTTFTIDTSTATFDDSNLVCRDGPKRGEDCNVAGEPDHALCGDCVGGSNPGAACDGDEDCLDGGTCDAHACVEICGAPFLDVDGETRDPGWWVAFDIDACAEVRIDLCCTDLEDGVVRPAWGTLYSDCPCRGIIDRTGVDQPIGIGRGTQGFARGGPHCHDDNLWHTYTLRAGTYYYPVYAVSPGSGRAAGVPSSPGSQLHITVGACPIAACCVEESCSVVTEFDCADAGGYWLSGNVSCGAQPDCAQPESDSPCCTGACCIDPYVCQDQLPSGEPMDATECAMQGGEFVGGAQCDDDPAPCPEGPCPRIEDEFPSSADVTIRISDPILACSCVPPDAPLPDYSPVPPDIGYGTKNRYMTFRGGDPGLNQAVRVTFTSMPGYEYAEGRTMWVQEPVPVTEASCCNGPTPPPTFWAATLGCSPYYTDWSQYDRVDVYGGSIVPNATYDVQLIDDNCETTSEAHYSSPLTVVMSAPGDIVGDCGPRPCTAPQGVVDFTDISACVEKLRNLPDAPRKARADVINSNILLPDPDRKVDFVDISCVVAAFGNDPCWPPGPPATDPCGRAARPAVPTAGFADRLSDYDVLWDDIEDYVSVSSAGLDDAIIERDCPPYQDGVPIGMEFTRLELAGESPGLLGRVFIHESPDKASEGALCNVDADDITGEFISGDSYFNLYLEINLPDVYGGIVVYNKLSDPIRVQHTRAIELPPFTRVYDPPGIDHPTVCGQPDPEEMVPLYLKENPDCLVGYLLHDKRHTCLPPPPSGD